MVKMRSLWLTICLLPAGCGTIVDFCHVFEQGGRHPYGGLVRDLEEIDKPHSTTTAKFQLLTRLDVPLSATADTLLIPVSIPLYWHALFKWDQWQMELQRACHADVGEKPEEREKYRITKRAEDEPGESETIDEKLQPQPTTE